MSSTELAAAEQVEISYLAQLSDADRRLVDAVVDELNEVHSLGNLETARQMGKIIVERFFDGELRSFHEAHKKTATYRALAEHPDLAPSYTSLWYAVAVYEHFLKIDAKVARALTLAHHRVLAHVHDAEARGAYAHAAVADKLTSEQLQKRIHSDAPPRSEDALPRGRRRLPQVVKGLSKAGRTLADMVADDQLETIVGEAMRDDERSEAIATARLISEQTLMLAERLERRVAK